MIDTRAETRRKLFRAGIILAAAVLLFWPALLNRSPLLFPDSFAYLYPGPHILGKLVGTHPPLSLYGMDRSEVFAIGLAILSVGGQLWTIVAFTSLGTAWVLWVLVRTLLPRHPESSYIAVMLVLTFCTSLAWYVGFVMPDAWGGLGYLALFLLFFAWKKQQAWERSLLGCCAVWALSIHTSHFLVALVLLACWATFVLFRRRRDPELRTGLALVVGVIFAAVALLGFVHKRLYGEVSLFGHPPPFLMARLIADGPARQYLKTHCAGSPWDICKYSETLPTDEDSFLHSAAGIYPRANAEERAALRSEQIPLLVKTIQTYPSAETRVATHNAWKELVSVGPLEFANIGPTPSGVRPSFAWSYEHSRQYMDDLPHDGMQKIQTVALLLSLVLIALLLPRCARRGDTMLVALSITVVISLVTNAVVTGTLSGVYVRYQDRVQWLIVLTALLLALSVYRCAEKPRLMS